MKTYTFARFRAAALVAAVLSVAGWGATLLAQTFTHNTTTVSTLQGATDTTLVVTSASAATGSSFGAIAAGQYVLVDQELELVTAVSSTTLTVQRRGRPTAHAAGTPVYIGPAGSFQNADPPAGGCTTANQPKFWINVITGGAAATGSGGVFTCGPNSVWARSSSPWFVPFASGSGATVTLTPGQSGQTLLFDRAAGIVYTLPAPFPGMVFEFVQTVTVTSNSAEIAVATPASQFIQGIVHIGIAGGATGSDWACNGTTHVAIKQNGTTTGGILGGRLRFIAVSTTIWQVDGLTIGSGTEATVCSTSV